MKPTKKIIKAELKRLRKFIERDDTPEIESRIAWVIEQSIRWATEETVGWPKPLKGVHKTSALIRQGISEHGREYLYRK